MSALGQKRRFGRSGRMSAITLIATKAAMSHDGRKGPITASRSAQETACLYHRKVGRSPADWGVLPFLAAGTLPLEAVKWQSALDNGISHRR